MYYITVYLKLIQYCISILTGKEKKDKFSHRNLQIKDSQYYVYILELKFWILKMVVVEHIPSHE